jgi:tryptophan 2,3-dioxygenase
VERLLVEESQSSVSEEGNKMYKDLKEKFVSIFDEEMHQDLVKQGKRRMSLKAWKAAIFINLYRDEPVMQMPFQILSLLADIDELLVTWRLGHALMVHRMLGLKVGTGGSSGYRYLQATATCHRCFPDLFNVSEFLIPRSSIPELPSEVKALIQENLFA